MRVAVVTVSDRASRGEYEDKSGPEITAALRAACPDAEFGAAIVPDERPEILAALRRFEGWDWIITTGGTGPAPRDVTPEATRDFIDRETPGIAEALRAESYKETPNAMFSRGIAGMRGATFVVNFPGSVKAVRLCSSVLAKVLEHGPKMARGEGH